MGEDTRRMLIAVSLSFSLMFCWQYFFPTKNLPTRVEQSQKIQAPSEVAVHVANQSASIRIDNKNAAKVKIETDSLKGSISTLGLRIDDLLLLHHKDNVALDANPVHLFNNASQFVDIKFCSSEPSIDVPDSNTVWHANRTNLTVSTPVEFSWTNGQGVKFLIKVSLDENYLFTFETNVQNYSNKSVFFSPCVQILKNKNLIADEINKSPHSGAIGAINKQVKDYSYKDFLKKGKLGFETETFHWFGITDKYWLTALIADRPTSATVEVSKVDLMNSEYMSNLISYSKQEIQPGLSLGNKFYLFAGAKHVTLLDQYRDTLSAPLLDRAIDFSWLYFLAKPLFYVLNFFFGLVKNFGVSIIMLTFVVRVAMFALVIKSDGTMRKMKELQPKMQRLKELYKNDQERLRKEIMELYKREKISPMGCLPLLAQAPVFFVMYKILDVTLEMRHAPFFLWIADLSVSDPTNIFTLFDLLQWHPPSFLHVGIWPMLMALTMYLQQKISPKPDDPMQARMFAIMPLVMLFVFGNVPAGLVIYWTCSNCFGIGQQYLMNILSKRRSRA